jgi:hypothetical protein
MAFNELSDIIFSIADKITDIEYKNIMDKMMEIRNDYLDKKEPEDEEKRCRCDPAEYQVCTSSIMNIMKCSNIPLIIRHVPEFQLFILSMDELFDTESIRRLQLEPTGFDIEQTPSEINKNSRIIRTLININNDGISNRSNSGKISRLFSAISIIDFVFRNFGFLVVMPKLKLSVYQKLQSFIEDIDDFHIMIIKNIYKIDEIPFVIWKQNMTPYIYGNSL